MVSLKEYKKTFIFLIIGLIIMGVILYFVGIDTVFIALKVANLWYVGLAILLQCIIYYLYTLRWYIINHSADMGDVKIRKLFPIVLVSLAINNITPSGRGGGEPVRAYILSRESKHSFDKTLATVIGDRALDTFPFIILAILTIMGMVITFSLSLVWIITLVICVVVITVLVVILIYMCINEAFGVKLTNWIIKLVKRFYKKFDEGTEGQIREAVSGFQGTMRNLISDKSVLMYALPLSFVIWILEILRVFVVFLAFGANISPIVIGEVFILASLVGMVPLLPGGIGAVDGIMIFFYSGAGITSTISAAATVIERLISYWMTTILGLIVLPVYGASVLDSLSKDKIRDLSNDSQLGSDEVSSEKVNSSDSDSSNSSEDSF